MLGRTDWENRKTNHYPRPSNSALRSAQGRSHPSTKHPLAGPPHQLTGAESLDELASLFTVHKRVDERVPERVHAGSRAEHLGTDSHPSPLKPVAAVSESYEYARVLYV
jgi:hypothetical protein